MDAQEYLQGLEKCREMLTSVYESDVNAGEKNQIAYVIGYLSLAHVYVSELRGDA